MYHFYKESFLIPVASYNKHIMQHIHALWSSSDCQPPSGNQQDSLLLTVGRLVTMST